MSGLDYVGLDELDGTHGWVVTSGFVNWEEDVAHHMPRQRVRLGDESTSGQGVVCTVFNDDLVLDEGCGYYLVGVDRTYEPRDEVQFSLFENSSIRKFHE
jgi:hypothetical protein